MSFQLVIHWVIGFICHIFIRMLLIFIVYFALCLFLFLQNECLHCFLLNKTITYKAPIKWCFVFPLLIYFFLFFDMLAGLTSLIGALEVTYFFLSSFFFCITSSFYFFSCFVLLFIFSFLIFLLVDISNVLKNKITFLFLFCITFSLSFFFKFSIHLSSASFG